MVPPTRRRALHGAAALLAAAAGCSGSSSMSSSSSALETAENVETDPDAYALRNPEDDPPAWIRPEGRRTREPGSATPEDPPAHPNTRGMIASRGTADRLSFADVDGVEGARTFVAETDFDRETLLLDSRPIDECYRFELCHVTWSSTEYHTYYARLYRDVEVACSTERRDGVAHLVRIPESLDPERVTGSGSGVSSSTCRGWERRLSARRAEAAARDATRRHETSPDATTGGHR